ncbi:Xyloglucan endotransglucosylase protein 2 [Asimina triloba]
MPPDKAEVKHPPGFHTKAKRRDLIWELFSHSHGNWKMDIVVMRWALIICMAVYGACGVAVTMGAAPKKAVDVPFQKNYVPTWASDHIKHVKGGSRVHLLLDKYSGTGDISFIFIQIANTISDYACMLLGGRSRLSSDGAEHDEIDFEFLGNRSNRPYILQTNVFTGGKGEREQRTYLWFDPTKHHHSYSILWNMYQIVFLVDDVPIRVFKNSKDLGVRYPFSQPMKIYSSLWNADDWATRGGQEKTDWSKAPFIASYTSFHVDGCEVSTPQSAQICATRGLRWWDQRAFEDLDGLQYRRLKWVRKKYTIYNYCTDRSRFPNMPPECPRDGDI